MQWLLTVTGTVSVLLLAGGPARGAEADTTKTGQAEAAGLATREPAVSKQDRVNVRGRASIGSEVVASLHKGELVTVLEEVTLSKPKTDEPAKWYRIVLPTNAAVWVHGDYVDKTAKTVRPKLLNLRGGPSENYSVLGRVERGTTLNIIGEKAPWLKIEPPPGACGYVAAHLLLKDAAAVAAASAHAPTLTAKEPAVTNVAPPVVVVETKTNEVPPVVAVPVVTNVVAVPAANEVVGITNPPVVTAVDTNVPAATNVSVPVAVAPAVGADTNPPPVPPIELVKRVITREGLLKGSFSIQAPSHFELRSLDNNRLIDYVWSPSTNIISTLKSYKGKKVLVTGEELLDERWPNTPVITAEEVVVAP
jgi:uncharacterized protein YgiM (DUF1202 family)